MTSKPRALITGAAQGIGYACAESLKEDGYDVILSISTKTGWPKPQKTRGGGDLCDMGDMAQIERMFETVAASHGPLHALVNNAGVAMPGDFLDYDVETFDKVISINLRGVFLATQMAARMMVEHKIEGAIVNMSSINAQVAILRSQHIVRRRAG